MLFTSSSISLLFLLFWLLLFFFLLFPSFFSFSFFLMLLGVHLSLPSSVSVLLSPSVFTSLFSSASFSHPPPLFHSSHFLFFLLCHLLFVILIQFYSFFPSPSPSLLLFFILLLFPSPPLSLFLVLRHRHLYCLMSFAG